MTRRRFWVLFLVGLVVTVFGFLLFALFVRYQHGNETSKSYYYKFFHFSSGIFGNSGLLRFENELIFDEEESSIVLKDVGEDGSELVMISRFGNENEYFCTGSCFCEDETNQRRVASTTTKLRRGLVYLLSSASSLLALKKAKEWFEQECLSMEIDHRECSTNIFSEVDSCEKLDEIREENRDGDVDTSETTPNRKHSVLFVCIGNYCRSPMCECIFKELPKKTEWEVDSCGTQPLSFSEHVIPFIEFWKKNVKGEPPDPKTMEVLRNHYGKDLKFESFAREITEEDIEKFEYILCMDDISYEDCVKFIQKKSNVRRPQVKRISDFSKGLFSEVPNPYELELEAFEEVYQMCKECCKNFLDEVEN